MSEASPCLRGEYGVFGDYQEPAFQTDYMSCWYDDWSLVSVQLHYVLGLDGVPGAEFNGGTVMTEQKNAADAVAIVMLPVDLSRWF